MNRNCATEECRDYTHAVGKRFVSRAFQRHEVKQDTVNCIAGLDRYARIRKSTIVQKGSLGMINDNGMDDVGLCAVLNAQRKCDFHYNQS